MKSIRFALGSFLFVALFAPDSMAQLQRAFVSGLGNDGNPCTRTAPCRTFAQAISQTNAGGEVVVLDSAGYGPATITQAVSITAPLGVHAGISVFSGIGITINAGPSDVVILRGLTITSQDTSGGSGILFASGFKLHVESCIVDGFVFGSVDTSGIAFLGAGNLEVKDSILRRNIQGILVKPSSGTASAAVDRVRLENNHGAGLFVQAGSTVTVSNSLSSGNVGGFVASSDTSGAMAELNIESCVASNNTTGVATETSSMGVARIRLSNSTVTNNSFVGILNDLSPAVFLSRGNNTVEGNGTDTIGTIGSYTAK
jgi:hypothetical protein